MKRNIKLLVEYDGTDYDGWQRQKSAPTIQACIEDGVERLTGEKVPLHGAGRTDSGVHALGQVANFHTESRIPESAFARALNASLPMDIVIRESCEVDAEFHSQFCAKAKAYEYRIACRSTRPALDFRYSHWVTEKLDLESMKRAAGCLLGTHDFSSFEAANSPRRSSVRTVNYIDIFQENGYIKITVEASGFLYRMVRNIAGTLIAVGRRRFEAEHVSIILDSKNRALAGPTVPAKGLFLKYVVY